MNLYPYVSVVLAVLNETGCIGLSGKIVFLILVVQFNLKLANLGLDNRTGQWDCKERHDLRTPACQGICESICVDDLRWDLRWFDRPYGFR